VGSDFRFCPWCAAPLRLKLVEFFLGDEELSGDRSLRVSRYLGNRRHVRFSVWHDQDRETRAEAVVSLSEKEAARLARFLDDSAPPRPPSLLERVYWWRVRHFPTAGERAASARAQARETVP
jgi:hypothetical protein